MRFPKFPTPLFCMISYLYISFYDFNDYYPNKIAAHLAWCASLSLSIVIRFMAYFLGLYLLDFEAIINLNYFVEVFI